MFSAGSGFDAAGNVDAPGAEGEDGFADISWMETAGENDAGFSGFSRRELLWRAPSPRFCRCRRKRLTVLRIEQDCIDVAMPGDGAQLVAEPFLGAGGVAVEIPVQGLDQKEAGAELVAQFFRERKIEFPMKLNPVQARRAESECNLIEILRVKDADFCEIGGQRPA